MHFGPKIIFTINLISLLKLIPAYIKRLSCVVQICSCSASHQFQPASSITEIGHESGGAVRRIGAFRTIRPSIALLTSAS